MKISENVSLAQYSTMRLGGMARYLVEVASEDELLQALAFADENNLRIHVVGGGSNTVFSGYGFEGLIIVNRIMGIDQLELEDGLELEVGAGENWDDIVALTVEKGFFDIAALSLIPGTVGAAPVQNIGAYGQQVSDSIVSVRAYSLEKKEFITILRQNCNFGYRSSRFNQEDRDKFIITSIKLRLNRKNIQPPFYADVSKYFLEHQIDENNLTADQLRQAVSTVRVVKLPDPSQVANCGSFFKNPVVDKKTFKKLKQNYPELKAHQTDDGNLKLYGAQLIELAGLKDFHDDETGMATWKNQALVMVNENAKTAEDLIKFKQKIIKKVAEKFGITLVQEPELV